jgi:hypothetical protein
VRISKRLIKRIAIGFGLLLGLLLIINSVLAWSAQRRLDQKIAELRAAGEPVSLADLAPTPIPPEKNAAVFLEQIAPDLERFEQEYLRFDKTPLGKQLIEKEEKDEPYTAEQRAAMRAIIDRYPTIVPTIEKAAACEQYASLLDFSRPASQFLDQSLKTPVYRKLVSDYVPQTMAVLVGEGKSDDAIRLGVRMLRLTRLRVGEPALVSHLVSLSGRGVIIDSIDKALRRNKVSRDIRTELDAELALGDTLEPLQAALRTERAFSIPYSMEQIGGIAGFLRWPALNRMLTELDELDLACRMSKQRRDELRPKWDQSSKRVVWPQLEGVNRQMIGQAISATFTAEFNYLTLSRCLGVLNALGEYRARTGKDAEVIDQLSLPHERIIDPYSGKLLLLKKTDAGWVVYSVWWNGIDDGGRFDFTDGDWGLAPPGYPRAD